VEDRSGGVISGQSREITDREDRIICLGRPALTAVMRYAPLPKVTKAPATKLPLSLKRKVPTAAARAAIETAVEAFHLANRLTVTLWMPAQSGSLRRLTVSSYITYLLHLSWKVDSRTKDVGACLLSAESGCLNSRCACEGTRPTVGQPISHRQAHRGERVGIAAAIERLAA